MWSREGREWHVECVTLFVQIFAFFSRKVAPSYLSSLLACKLVMYLSGSLAPCVIWSVYVFTLVLGWKVVRVLMFFPRSIRAIRCLLCLRALSLDICWQYKTNIRRAHFKQHSIKWVCTRNGILLAPPHPTPSLTYQQALVQVQTELCKWKGFKQCHITKWWQCKWTSSIKLASRDCARANELEVA